MLSKTERRLLGLLFRRGAMTQSALAEILEITQQSVSRLIGGLVEGGLVQYGEKVSAGRRPSMAIMLAPDHARSVGIAILADAVSMTILDFAGRPVAAQRARLPSMEVAAVLEWVDRTLDALTAAGPSRTALVGVGVSISGSFVGAEVGFNTPHALEGWAKADVAAIFAERLGLPGWADNDGNTAALAESILGVGRWAASFGYLYLATGVGGGVVLDGLPWRGRFGNAGEFAGGLPPNIYPFPSLDLLRQILARDGTVFETVSAMVDAYDPAWPAIDDWIARVRDSVSIIASNATAILDLEAIVFGGLIPRDLAERLIARVELFDQKRRSIERPTGKLVASEVEGDAAAIGAGMLPLRATFLR